MVKPRLAALLAVLAVVCAVAVSSRVGNLQEQDLRKQSLETLQAAAARPDAPPLTSLVYGEKLADAGRLPEALAAFQHAAAALKPDQKDAVAERVNARVGYTLAGLSRDDEAVPYLDRARKINEDDPLLPLGYGTVFFHRNMYHFAVNQFKLATALAPDNYEAHYLLGKAYNESVQPQAAVPELTRAIALSPHFAPAHAELGHAYAYQAQFPKAVEEFRNALKCDPGDMVSQRALGAALGMSARSRAEYRQAVESLEQTLKIEPDNETLVFTLGQLHLRFQNMDEAHRYLTRAVQMNPGYTEAWYNLERVEQFLGNDEAARADDIKFKRLRALHDNAIDAEKKVSSNLKDPAARVNLARRYREAGNVIGAYWQLKTALKLAPDLAEANQELRSISQQYQLAMSRRDARSAKGDTSNTFGPPPPPEMMGPNGALTTTGQP